MTAIADLVRLYFRAYETADRSAMEPLIAEGFRFKSPFDDNIDRATYFERCWPHAGGRRFDILTLFSEGNEALIRYECTWDDGRTHRCTEFFRSDGEKIEYVDVYFGFKV